jgi:hypothetical protein
MGRPGDPFRLKGSQAVAAVMMGAELQEVAPGGSLRALQALNYFLSYDIQYEIIRSCSMPAVVHFSESAELAPLAEKARVAAVVKAVVWAAEAWKLSNAQAAALFDVPPATWSRMKAGAFKGNLDQDKVTRASLMIGLFKGLRLLFNGPLTYGWPKTPNSGPGFNGRTPVEVMIAGGIPAMMTVRQHIDALRGGM